MSCQYPKEYKHHTKIFCKVVGDRCASLFKVSTQSEVKENGKYSRTYESVGRMLTVKIDKLTEDDTAVYWCGVDSTERINWINKVKAFVLHVSPLFGYEGGELNIRCPYEKGNENNDNYLSRVDSSDNKSKTLIQSKFKTKTKGRFFLYNDITSKVFTVTISGLSAEDSGKYMCGVKGFFSGDTHQELQVLVKELVNVTGYEGESVSITCKYHREDTRHNENIKYLCKGQSPSDCINTGIKVQSNMTKAARFSLRDEPSSGIFTVSISDLRTEDSGIYWCGVYENRHIFTQAVHLEVRMQDLPVILSVSLATAVLLTGTGVVLSLYCRHRGKKRQDSSLQATTTEATDHYQNVPQGGSHEQQINPAQNDPVYQSLNPNTMEENQVYQSLNTNQGQNQVYQSLNPNTMEENQLYQSLKAKQGQNQVYQSLNLNTIQPDPIYQDLNPNTT